MNSGNLFLKINKKSLTFITKDRPASEETLVKFLTEVDATLNSRPLTQCTQSKSFYFRKEVFLSQP